MAVTERITQRVQRLPEPLQAEVLDFVEYLLTKTGQETAKKEDREWSQLSLSFAMRDMDDEDADEYTVADLKESFS